VAKVYRAARIICAQPMASSGTSVPAAGVASQEQYHSAYGLAKAFLEMNMPIPVVVRLGGNSEDRAVEILQDACKEPACRRRGLPQGRHAGRRARKRFAGARRRQRRSAPA
jgi:succinyl-CoA synthetase beta subunit